MQVNAAGSASGVKTGMVLDSDLLPLSVTLGEAAAASGLEEAGN